MTMRGRFRLSLPLAAAVFLFVSADAPAQLRFDRGGVFSVGETPKAAALADVDGNGVLDVFVANERNDRLSLFLGRVDPDTGSWLGTPVDEEQGIGEEEDGLYDGSPDVPGFDTLANPIDLGTGDFDADGVPDVVIAEYLGRSVSVRQGRRDGMLAAPVTFFTNDRPIRVRPADLDGDGVADLAVGGLSDFHVLFGTRDGRLFEPPIRLFARNRLSFAGADVADVDGDGDLDLAGIESPSAPARVTVGFFVFENDGVRGFSVREPVVIHPDLARVRDLRAADLDLDGRPEFVAASPELGLVVLPGDGSPARVFATGDDAAFVGVADLDRDGFPDVVTPNSGAASTFSVVTGDGRGGFELPPARFQAGTRLQKLAIGDLDGDSRLDLVIPSVGFEDFAHGDFEIYFDRSGSFIGAGTVNAGRGTIVDVLFVNGATGGPSRRVVVVERHSPLAVFLDGPPAADVPVPFVIFAWTEFGPGGAGFPQPYGIGRTSHPTPLSGGSPQPVFAWNSSGRERLGPRSRHCELAPCFLVDRPLGVARPASVHLQGIVADPASAGDRPASVTNGVTVEIR